MGDIHYMISEAAKNVGVESHVLRYWEEELNLTIGRTEMGHRYYTEEDVQLFQCIRRLKDEGVLLKELKVLIPEIQHAKTFKCTPKQSDEDKKVVENKIEKKKEETKLEATLRRNNQILEKELCAMVTKTMKREMSYLLDANEQLQEDRYRKLDTLIRQQQILRKEQAQKSIPVRMKQVFAAAHLF